MKRPAFTLLELLISATLFATVAMMTISILATSGNVQNAGQQSQVTSSELQQAVSSIKQALTRADTSVNPITINTDSSHNNNSILIFQTNIPQIDGTAAATSQYEVYCMTTSNGTTQLLQFIEPTGATMSGAANTITSCDPTSIKSHFTGATSSTNYLTDSSTKVYDFLIQAEQNAGDTGADAYALELTGMYYNPNARATDVTTLPITLRDTAVLLSNPPISNLSQ